MRLGALLAELELDSRALADSFAKITRTAEKRRGKLLGGLGTRISRSST